MAGILRGDIYWCDLEPAKGNEQKGIRPVLILSNNIFNRHSKTVIAAALTSQPQSAGYPLTMEIASRKLPKKSWVKISQIRTLSIDRLSGKIAELSTEETDAIVRGLNQILKEI